MSVVTMIIMMVAILSTEFLTEVSCSNIKPWCPNGCDCDYRPGIGIQVDCSRSSGSSISNDNHFSRVFDSLLSSEDFGKSQMPHTIDTSVPQPVTVFQKLNGISTQMLLTYSNSSITSELKVVGNEGEETLNRQVAVCPQNCTCNLNSDKLFIACSGRSGDSHLLYDELNSTLATDELRERLTSLQITNSPLVTIPTTLCRLANLTHLNLDRNCLNQLPDNCLNRLTRLDSFSACYNDIGVLQDGLFDTMQKLRDIRLTDNRISSIGLRVFSNVSDLTSVRLIDLARNQIITLEPWPYIRGLVSSRASPTIVLLNLNKIYNFTNTIGCNISCSSERAHLKLDISRNQIQYITDLLRGWNMNMIQFYCMLNLRDFNDSHPGVEIDLGGNPYTCDCRDYEFYAYEKTLRYSKFLQAVRCSYVGFLGDQRVTAIDLNYFVCNVSEGCPRGCKCMYRPGNLTFHVNCSTANLSSLPLELPPLPKSTVRYKLDFRNNRFLRKLENRSYFAQSVIVDLRNSRIDEIKADAWESLLYTEQLLLAGNELETLPREVADINVTKTAVSLSGNPWKCSCHDKWISSWMKSLVRGTVDSPVPSCQTPSRLRGKNIVEMTEFDFCVDPVHRAVIKSVLAAATVALVLSAFGLAVYRLRSRVYTKWKFHPFDRDECVGEDMEYDVFLCSSYEDNHHHGLRILELLESKGYRVCYHVRDFLPGELITNSMSRAVERSKRTVCLLTNNFLQSPFCRTEFEMAYHHNVTVKRKKRLVVLMALDNINNLDAYDGSDTAALRQCLRQYTYIDYRAYDWLDKLLYALPLHGMNTDEMEHDNHVDDVYNENNENDILMIP